MRRVIIWYVIQKPPFGAQHELQNPRKAERVVIIGTGDHAALAFECFTLDSPHEVAAFSAEPAFIHSGEYCGRPVIPFTRLASVYPPSEYRVFVAASGSQMNRVRRRLFEAARSAGFGFVSYVSRSSFVWNNVKIGDNVFIGELNLLHHGVSIGDNVVIASGAHLGHGTVIGDDCYVASRATFAGDCQVGRGCFVGVGSCIANNRILAEDCLIGAGAVVVKDTEARQVYAGNPARPTGRDSFETFRVNTGMTDPE